MAILRLGRRRKRAPQETSTRGVVRQEENADAIEAVVEEGVDAEDDVVEAVVDEAPHRGCQAWGHVGDEGTRRFCQHRACGDGDQHELYAMSEGPAEEASGTVAAQTA